MVAIDPVVSPWIGDRQTLTGSAIYIPPIASNLDVTVVVYGASETVATRASGAFSIDIPLHTGLNSLTVIAHNDFEFLPNACRGLWRHDSAGGALEICACDTAPCTCAPTPSPSPAASAPGDHLH
jgi:hypothetical protein